MIDCDNLKCPVCGSFSLKQGSLRSVNGQYTTRKEREENGLEEDDKHTLENRPYDKTWYGCIMCNNEFDRDGTIYKEKKIYPFGTKNA